MAYSSLTSMTYLKSVDNSGNGVKVRFAFEGVNNGNLDANDTWAISLNNTDGPEAMVIDKSTFEQIDGLTAKILTSNVVSGNNVSGTLEIYPLTAGTTYTFQAYGSAGSYTPSLYFDFTPVLDNNPNTKNLSSGTLAESVSASTTTLLVYVGDGSASTIKSVWPDTPFYATLMPSNPTAGVPNSLDSEIVKVTAVNNDQVGNTALSVIRGQRGTTAKAFSADAVVTNGIFMDDILSRIYPIGSIFMSVTHSTVAQVQEALGGTWVAWGAGRVPVGVDTTDTAFDTVEETGGEKTHTLTIAEMPSHNHKLLPQADSSGSSSGHTTAWGKYSGARQNTQNTGGDGAHNNLQPYITCYMYKRTA